MLKNRNLLLLVKTMDLGGAERFTVEISKSLKNHFQSITVASSGGPYEDLLKQNGIKHITLKEELRISNIAGIVKELRFITKNNLFDIVHTQHRILQFAIQCIPGKMFKNVYTSHNYFSDIYQKMIFADKAVAVSPRIKNNLKKTTFIKEDKISFIPCGTEIMPEVPCKLRSPIVFGFSGRLIKEKGVYLLLYAAAILRNEGYRFRIVYRGLGDVELIKEIIQNIDLEDRVSILPFTTNTEDIYNEFDVLVLPSVYNEGLPLSVLEAASRKKLIITTPAGGTGDFIKHEISGLLIRDLLPTTLVEEMRYVIDQEVNYEKLTSNAYHLVKDEYSLETARDKYLKLYCSLF